MASTHKHIRSSTANKRPTTAIADGQIALNTNSTSPGLFFKDSTGATIIKVGPVHIGATAPNATPPSGGSSGNSTGEVWLDTSLTPNGVKIWNGASWTNATPIGSTTVQGLLELATNAETQTGTDPDRAVTPAGLQSKVSDSTSTTSSTTIASSTAVKSAYDLANAALPKSGGTVTGNLEIGTTGSLSFEGATADAFETTIAVVDPTADRTITLPDTTGTVVTTGDTGTVTSTMIADGTIVNGDVNASAAIAYSKLNLATSIVDGDISATAEIAVSKLADGTARQLLQTDAAGTGVEWASNIDIPGTLDVTSAATFDSSATIVGDLTVDTSTLKVDSTNNRVGIGTTSAAALLHVSGTAAAGDVATRIENASATDSAASATLEFVQGAGYSAGKIVSVRQGNYSSTAASQDSALAFHTALDGVNNERARIDSSGRLLVGVTSTSADSRAIIQGRSAGSTGNGVLYLARNSSPGTNGNPLGTLNFSDDGHVANAQIEAVRDGATYTSGSDQPAALTFSTTADGTATLSERMRIDSSGRLLVGTSSARSNGVSSSYNLLVESPTYGTAVLASNANNASTGGLYFVKSRGAANGGTTVVQSGDGIGRIAFSGTDGSNPIPAAYIDCAVDGTPGANDMPGRLVFSTTADGASAPTEAMRIDSSGRLLVGTTTSIPVGSATGSNIQLADGVGFQSLSRWVNNGSGPALVLGKSRSATVGTYSIVLSGDTLGQLVFAGDDGTDIQTVAATIKGEVDGTPGANDMPGRLVFSTTADGASTVTERMRIDNDGNVLIGTTSAYAATSSSATGFYAQSTGIIAAYANANAALFIGRQTNDGTLVAFYQAGTQEGTISVSGTTVSYNGAHLSRWSQLPSDQEREEILRGTVLSNIDEMCEWGDEENEQLNRMKVSDVEGDKNVSGVFQAWDDDDDTYTDDFYCAMTGDFIIRIAEGVTVERGDLLMSAGDGTAKPQDDDIIRSKTIAKVTSTHVSCTYEDGSYCVPCVLMAC